MRIGIDPWNKNVSMSSRPVDGNAYAHSCESESIEDDSLDLGSVGIDVLAVLIRPGSRKLAHRRCAPIRKDSITQDVVNARRHRAVCGERCAIDHGHVIGFSKINLYVASVSCTPYVDWNVGRMNQTHCGP